MPTIEEIVVMGYGLPRRDPYLEAQRMGDILRAQSIVPIRPDLAPTGGGGRAFLPPVLPLVITEIIEEVTVTAPKVAKVPLGGIGGVLTGLAMIGAEMAREFSQQRLDEAYRVFQDVQPRPKDSPVKTIEPEVIPEIVVTARRPFPGPVRIPQDYSFIGPDTDPFVMVPISPRFMPTQPAAVPDIAVPQPILPEIQPLPLDIPLPLPTIQPLPLPTIQPFPGPGTIVAPLPQAQPQPSPLPLPLPQPLPLPLPDILPQPFAPPAPVPLTPTSPVGVSFPFPFATPLPLTQPRLATPSKKCPPCKKQKEKKEKKRTECWKKLVKEGITAKQDKEFRWVPIDCRTGREL